jgi:hypothetical protein
MFSNNCVNSPPMGSAVLCYDTTQQNWYALGANGKFAPFNAIFGKVTASGTITAGGTITGATLSSTGNMSASGTIAGNLQNTCQGSAALSSGTVTVTNSCIVGTRPVLIMPLNDTNLVHVSALSAGSVTFTSASGTDTATVYWSQN